MSFPSPADDYLEPRLQLDSLIIHPAATFFLRMKGVATAMGHAPDASLSTLYYQVE
jgi:hypothetical protein